MTNRTLPTQSRRQFLRAALILSPGVALAACSAPAAPAQTPPAATAEPAATEPADAASTAAMTATEMPVAEPTLAPTAPALPPTPACGDDDDPTPPQTAGPFYTPDTPERSSFLEPGITGTRMVVQGAVLDTACQPIAGAMLDVWHADDAGRYDNVGYKLRGHFFADADGRFALETIVPGLYPGRTRHFHVRVQAPNQPPLTTQLYIPGEPANAQDRFYLPALELEVQTAADGSKVGTFDFVLPRAS